MTKSWLVLDCLADFCKREEPLIDTISIGETLQLVTVRMYYRHIDTPICFSVPIGAYLQRSLINRMLEDSYNFYLKIIDLKGTND